MLPYEGGFGRREPVASWEGSLRPWVLPPRCVLWVVMLLPPPPSSLCLRASGGGQPLCRSGRVGSGSEGAGKGFWGTLGWYGGVAQRWGRVVVGLGVEKRGAI